MVCQFLDVEKCKSVLFVKEVYHQVMQVLIMIYFIKKILLMLFADAKKMTEDILQKIYKY